MKSTKYYLIAVAILCFTFPVFSSTNAFAGVLVYDIVTSSKKAIQLKAYTKGRFFSDGGRLVTFYIDDEKIGTTLSGGDAYAYLKYAPSSSGLKDLRAESDGETNDGVVLVTGRNDRVLLVEVEKNARGISF